MDIWKTFAYISGGKVRNIACYLYEAVMAAFDDARLYCSDIEAIAVDVTHIPVQIGDDYNNGVFSRDDVVINPLPTVEQQTAQNTADIDDLWVAILEG